MEIPENLKNLYKHWEYHTIKPNTQKTNFQDKTLIKQICSFASERMEIWEKKQNGEKTPYTEDKVLASYRFCNIYRELDRQTIEIHTMLKPFEEDFDIWLLNVAFSRMVCNPQTIQKVGFLNYDDKNNKKVYEKLKTLPSPKYGAAYIFPISLVKKVGSRDREEFFCFYLPKVIKN